MAKFKVTSLSFINNSLVQADEEVEIDVKKMKPGSNLEPVKDGKKESKEPAQTGSDEAPV